MGLSVSAYGGYNTLFPIYNSSPVSRVSGSPNVTRGSEGVANNTAEANAKTSGINTGKTECQTCKERKYVDGSDENVSFKTPGHIAPESSGAVVMAHEREHVANAVAEGSKPNKELVSSTVSLKTSICPECGRSYVSGGVTNTTMRTTSKPTNPYAKLQQQMNRNMLAGANFDMSA